MERNYSRPIKCPVCSSRHLDLDQISTNISLRVEQSEEGDIKKIPNKSRKMIDSHVQGTCRDCEHSWRVRGISAIADLPYATSTLKRKRANERKRIIQTVSVRE